MFLLLLLALNICADAAQITNKVFFDITIGGRPEGRIVFGLYGNTVPKTVENFRALATGEKGRSSSGVLLSYKGSTFHRIIPEFATWGGDIVKKDGTSGESIYGKKFDDENFKVKFTKRFMLSMANAGPNTANSQFMISFQRTPWLDNRQVAFGEVIQGQEVLLKIQDQGSMNGRPKQKVVIADCGEMPMEDAAEEVAVAATYDCEKVGEEVKDKFAYTSDECDACVKVGGGGKCGWSIDGKCVNARKAYMTSARDCMLGDIYAENEKAHEAEAALAYAKVKDPAARGLTLVHVMAALGFTLTVYGAFRHYTK